MNIFETVWHNLLRRPYKLEKSVDTGKGKTVLLIHGLGTDGSTWLPVIEQMNLKKWHVIGYDLLGFGRSPKPLNSKYNVSEHTKSLFASLDRQVKKKKIVVIGHSMGCLVASHLAWLYPDLIERMILYEPPLFADSPEFRSHKRRRRFYFAFYNELLKRPKQLIKYTNLIAKIAEGRIITLDEKKWHPFEKSLMNTIMDQKAYNELKMVEVPTDIIYGKYDFIVTRKEVKDMLKANTNIKFHLVNEMHDVTEKAGKYIISLLERRSRTSNA